MIAMYPSLWIDGSNIAAWICYLYQQIGIEHRKYQLEHTWRVILSSFVYSDAHRPLYNCIIVNVGHPCVCCLNNGI